LRRRRPTIEKQGLNAKRVVSNLLSFAHVTEHKESVVEVNENLEEVMDVLRMTLSLNKIAVKTELAQALPKVQGEPEELHQVFVNIINNAIAVMKGGGVLTIATRLAEEGGRAVIVRISDTGSGIKKEHRSRIFDPLFTTKKVGEGTGLGLSVSYGIITRHGGAISFVTKTPDESSEPGTTFFITLPAAEDAQPAAIPRAGVRDDGAERAGENTHR
jgi:two-component system NtrC family sensor kinase